jgi:hypothetical protein
MSGNIDQGAVVLSRTEEHVAEWLDMEKLDDNDLEEAGNESYPSNRTELKNWH